MTRFRSILLASTLTIVPTVALVVPVTAVAQETPAKQDAAKQDAAKQDAAKQDAAKQDAAKQDVANQDATKQETSAVREIEIVVDRGYKPGRIEVSEGERVRLKFIRREYTPCTREVVIPSLNIRQELPTNKPVTVELPPLKAGDVEFQCGMKMVRGTLAVSPRKS